jgi:hypothetical protein
MHKQNENATLDSQIIFSEFRGRKKSGQLPARSGVALMNS